MKTCPVCGKRHVVMWPEFWPYRRGEVFFCSQNCMDVDYYRTMNTLKQLHRMRKEGNKMATKLTLEQKRKSVEIAKSGKSPLPYLKECGARNPSTSWETIRNNYLKTHKGEDLPKSFRQPAKAEPVDTVKVTGPLKIETPEGNQVHVIKTPEKKTDDELKKPLEKIVGPCHIDRFLITAIKHTELGEFYYDKKFQKLDWRTPEGDEVSMSPNEWTNLLNELPHVLRILGVFIYE